MIHENMSQTLGMIRVVSTLLLVAWTGLSTANAQTVPPLINYQGRLTGADGAGIEGMRKLEFCIWKDVASSASTNLVWGPQTFAAVPLVGGHFNVILGTTDTQGRSIADAFGGENRYLETTVYDANGANPAAIAPRQQILSAPYALTARLAHNASKVEDGMIEGTPIGQETPDRGRFTVVEAGETRCGIISASSNGQSVIVSTTGSGTFYHKTDNTFGHGTEDFTSTGNYTENRTFVEYNNFTLNHTLTPANAQLVILVRGTFTLRGSIEATGRGAYGAGRTGGAGASGYNGAGSAGSGGAGGSQSYIGGSGGQTDLPGGTPVPENHGGVGISPSAWHTDRTFWNRQCCYGAGGGSGASLIVPVYTGSGFTSVTFPGGAGGRGGGGVLIIARNVVVEGTASLISNGTNGDQTDTLSGGGGGFFGVYFETLNGVLPIPNINGGSGGSATRSGGAGGNGAHIFRKL